MQMSLEVCLSQVCSRSLPQNLGLLKCGCGKGRNEYRVEDLKVEAFLPHHVSLVALELKGLVCKRHFCSCDCLFPLCWNALGVAMGVKGQAQNSALWFLAKVKDPAVKA